MTRKPTAGMTKNEVIRASNALDERRQKQIAAQIDSINRLLGVQETDDGPSARYGAEIANLNHTIAAWELTVDRQAAILRRLRQMAIDTADANALMDPRRVLTILNELSDETG